METPTCIVAQPFDRGEFDERFVLVLAPAILEAGLRPYRVDQDPAASIPVDHLEFWIRRGEVFLADISTDSANVWLEVGYALACGHDPVLLCRRGARGRLPFDVQHRQVIEYDPTTPEGLLELRSRVVTRVRAVAAERRAKAEWERELDRKLARPFGLGRVVANPLVSLLAAVCIILGGFLYVTRAQLRQSQALLRDVTLYANDRLRPLGYEIRYGIPWEPGGSRSDSTGRSLALPGGLTPR